jgi:diguanylate cyclase (GGDEF)-like protein
MGRTVASAANSCFAPSTPRAPSVNSAALASRAAGHSPAARSGKWSFFTRKTGTLEEALKSHRQRSIVPLCSPVFGPGAFQSFPIPIPDVNDFSFPPIASARSAGLPASRSWLRLMPAAVALLTALVLFAAQQLYFEIQEAHDSAVGEAESLLNLMRATRTLDVASSGIELGEAVRTFQDVTAARYCRGERCVDVQTAARQQSCGRSDWQSLCVTARSAETDETVSVRYSLVSSHIESLRNMLCFAIILSIATAVAWAGSRKLRHRLNSAQQLLRHAATHDALTGLPNRSEFEARAGRIISSRRRGALLFLDLDGFKEINDHYGHHTGDRVLCETARRIRAALADRDEMGRLGGDEFGILVPCGADLTLANRTAEALIRCFADPIEIDGRTMTVGASIGCVALDRGLTRFDEALRRADVALYEVKRSGRGRMLYFDPAMDVVARTRYELQSELKLAIDNGQLFLEYQPQVAADGGLRGVEALVRWQHPSRGLIRPDQFIDIAEESGLINALGLRVVEIACVDLVRARARGMTLPYVGVNVSARQLKDLRLVVTLNETLQRHGLSAQDLELEITESSLMESSGGDRVLQRFAEAGFRIAIDDFGTGYSSLSRLQSMPVDKLKIDRAFISQLFDVGHGAVIAETILALAQRMRLRTVAEGVETPAQAAWLRAAGCSLLQGYLFARPMPFERLLEWARENETQAHTEPALPA